MKPLLLLLATLLAALASGCAIGPSGTASINPFDWSDISTSSPVAVHSGTSNVTASGVSVASR